MSGACPVLGFVVTVALDSAVTAPELDTLRNDLIDLLETNQLSREGRGHPVHEYVVTREGAQATEQDRVLVRSWAARWAHRWRITVGDLVDLDAEE
jgi:uncharacterized protein YggL (DUF469 family)